MKKTGIELIAEERQEQIEKHGFSLENDQYYSNGELIEASKFCIEQAKKPKPEYETCKWPENWDDYFEDKIRNKTTVGKLTVAGAFLMAENDRIGSNLHDLEIKEIAAEIDRLQAKEL